MRVFVAVLLCVCIWLIWAWDQGRVPDDATHIPLAMPNKTVVDTIAKAQAKASLPTPPPKTNLISTMDPMCATVDGVQSGKPDAATLRSLAAFLGPGVSIAEAVDFADVTEGSRSWSSHPSPRVDDPKLLDAMAEAGDVGAADAHVFHIAFRELDEPALIRELDRVEARFFRLATHHADLDILGSLSMAYTFAIGYCGERFGSESACAKLFRARRSALIEVFWEGGHLAAQMLADFEREPDQVPEWIWPEGYRKQIRALKSSDSHAVDAERERYTAQLSWLSRPLIASARRDRTRALLFSESGKRWHEMVSACGREQAKRSKRR